MTVSAETVSFIDQKGGTYEVPRKAFKTIFTGDITLEKMETKLNYLVEGSIVGTLIEPVSTF